MSHLSSDEICRVVMGDESRHARECVKCRGEVERLESALGLFRGAVAQISAQTPQPMLFSPVRSGSYRPREAAAGLYSLLFHSAAIAGILVIGSLPQVHKIVQPLATYLIAPPLRSYVEEMKGGGGGGGMRSPLDASKGDLPKSSTRQFVPPRVDPIQNARLPMTPTIIADAPDIAVTAYGDPLSRLGVPSNGPGCCLGIGGGDDGGIGIGHGPGAGPGNGGFRLNAFRVAGGVSSPVLIAKVEPEYSDEARKAKYQGMVKLEVLVDEHGVPREFKVIRAAGLGLDEKAIEAVAKWKFKPGTKNGKPVPVIAVIEVSFRLL